MLQKKQKSNKQMLKQKLKLIELQTEHMLKKREDEYPSVEDQLDDIYHNGN